MSTRSIFGKHTDPQCIEAVERAARALSDAGHHVEPADLPIDRDRLAHAYLVQVGVGVSGEIADMARWTGRRPTAAQFEASTWFLHQVGMSMGEPSRRSRLGRGAWPGARSSATSRLAPTRAALA